VRLAGGSRLGDAGRGYQEELGGYVFECVKAKLISNGLRVVGCGCANANQFDPGLLENCGDKGITLLTGFMFMRSIVELNNNARLQGGWVDKDKVYTFETDTISKGSSGLSVMGFGLYEGPQGKLWKDCILFSHCGLKSPEELRLSVCQNRSLSQLDA
jgi:hypothetical protein